REPFATLDLAAEVGELPLGDPSLEEGPRIDAGCGVTLEEDLVARSLVLAAEEVVEADFVEAGARGVRGQVAADSPGRLGPLEDHERGVPADDAPDAQLHGLVTRERRLLLGRDRVDVARLHQAGNSDTELPGALEDLAQQEVGALGPRGLDHAVEGLDPLARF